MGAAALIAAAAANTPVAEAATAFNAHLTRAPYLTDLVGLHVNVNWATDQSATTGSLQWGPATGGSCTPSTTVTPTRKSITVGTVKEYQWTAALTLPSQGTYCYQPQLAGASLLGTNPNPQFTTQAAAGGTAPFSFDVMGDWGMVNTSGTNPDQASLDAQIAASGARFLVTVGDNGYNSGSQTNYGDLQQTGDSTSAIFGPSFWTVAGSSIPIFTAPGNHGLSGTTHTDITTWTQDQAVSSSGGIYANGTYNCCTGGTVNYGNEWYAFNAGPARFYVLDSAWGDSNGGTSTPYGQDYANHFSPAAPTPSEYSWLVNDLQAHPGVMKFAFMHYPWYSANSSQTSDTFMTTVQPGASESVQQLFADNDVKIVFNGHAHIYERNNPSAPGMPVTYVTGGGGATLEPVTLCGGNVAYATGWSPSKLKGYACGSASPPLSASKVFHFLKVTVAGSSVTVTPTAEDGSTFDSQTYNFATSLDTVIDTAPASLTNATTATFTFHATAGGATYACSLDGAAATPCTSPASYSGLSQGAHTFSVTATANGSTDPTPATDTWTVDTTPPSAPTGLTATATAPTTVNLSWSGSTDSNGISGYDIVRNGTTIGTVPGNTTGYVDASASPATSYTYTVDARDGAGNVSQPSGQATATTPSGTVSPALVQAVGSITGTVTLPRPSTQGDLLVLSASVYTGATNHITQVTDSAGNQWTRIGAYDVSGHNSDGEMWYSPNAASVTTVTVHLSTTVNTAIEVQEFSGVATASPLDISAGSSATSTGADSSPITPAAGNELLVGFAAGHANGQAMTVSSQGFTLQPQLQTTSPSVASIVTGSKVLSTPSAQSFAASFAAPMYWAAGIAAFRAAS
jgi:hypothetical protein